MPLKTLVEFTTYVWTCPHCKEDKGGTNLENAVKHNLARLSEVVFEVKICTTTREKYYLVFNQVEFLTTQIPDEFLITIPTMRRVTCPKS